MHAHRFELMAPGVGDGSLAAVGQHDRRAVGGVQRIEQRARRKLRRLGKLLLHVLGADRPDIGDLAAAQERKPFRRDHLVPGGDMVTSHGTRLLSTLNCRALVEVQSWSRMLIVFTIRSGSGRARSIESSPFFRSAPSTSKPSASTKVRWNWRAAMPRWRYCRAFSSCWRPRMTSWLSSTVTSS